MEHYDKVDLTTWHHVKIAVGSLVVEGPDGLIMWMTEHVDGGKWRLNLTIEGTDREPSYYNFYFKDPNTAILFKLRWME